MVKAWYYEPKGHRFKPSPCIFITRIFQKIIRLIKKSSFVIVNLLLVEHKTVFTLVSLDIFVTDTTSLDNYSQLGLSL